MGVMPLGAILGAGTAPLLMKVTTRKQFVLVCNLLALMIAGIIQISNMYVLLVCRVVQGILTGLFMAITPIYINELVPKQVLGSFGVFTQLFVVFAIVFTFALGAILEDVGASPFVFYRVMVSYNVVLILLQSVLLMTGFIPESPNSLISKNRNEQAKEVIALFTVPAYVGTAFRQKQMEVEAEHKGKDPL
jgi:MFS family permease